MMENRTVTIKIRLTESEKEMLISRAKADGKSISAYIRESSLKGICISKTDIQIVYELRKIGANINQLVKYVHQLPVDENIAYALKRIHEYMDELETIKKKLL